MERLSDTAIDIINELHTERLYYVSEYLPLIDAAHRLSDYEDTGLEPEKIMTLCEMEKRTRMAKMLRWEEAEQEGRLVVLPCKEGDKVYVLLIGRVISVEITSVNLDGKGTPLFWAIHEPRLMYAFRPEDIGKTVFLTREEAEQALEIQNT